jgi:hypothetical protein
METIQNKYKVWHDNIIANGKKRKLIGFKERHHILPRSLGGNNSKDNLVDLTPKEHFIIHILLCKFTLGKARIKMLQALHCMIYFTTKRRKYKTTSRIVEKLRIEAQKNNPVFDPEVRKKIGLKSKGRKFSKETRLKMSKARIGNKNALGLKHSEEFKEKIRNKHKDNKYCVGKRYLNKDGKNLVVNKSEVDKYLKQGYKLGMDKSYITLNIENTNQKWLKHIIGDQHNGLHRYR